MGIFDRITSVAAAGTTFAANFWPWLLAAFLLGAGVAGLGAFTLGKLIYQGEALRAQTHLAQFKEQLSASAAMGEAEAARRQGEALEAIRARDADANAAVAAIPGQVAAILAPKFIALRESINDPKYDCLRIPYPPPALRLLERPGGRAPEDRGSGETRADPGSVPDAARAPTP